MHGEHDVILGQQSSYLIPQLRTVVDQAAADAMKRLQVLRGHGLLGNKPHLGPADGLTNRGGISCIILLTGQIRLDEPGSDYLQLRCPSSLWFRLSLVYQVFNVLVDGPVLALLGQYAPK